MLEQLEKIAIRYNELNESLQNEKILQDPDKVQSYSKEKSELLPAFELYQGLSKVNKDLEDCEAILQKSKDSELKQLALVEKDELIKKQAELTQKAKIIIIPKDPRDNKNVILEIRAGTGGDEASLFAADLLKLYTKFSEIKKWKIEILEIHTAFAGGYKFVVVNIKGKNVYSFLKFESGTHRVQRVPITESQGRIHTSAVTIAVLAEAEPVDIIVKTSDLKIDTFRAQGAGGQHVNKTDSAVRITHLPTNIVVSCQDERSQTKNKDKALKYLRTKLYEKKVSEMNKAQSSLRKEMVGSGDRSEKIRTYNYPQNRITDHRIKMTKNSLDEIMSSGNISDFVEALLAKDQADKIEAEMKK